MEIRNDFMCLDLRRDEKSFEMCINILWSLIILGWPCMTDRTLKSYYKVEGFRKFAVKWYGHFSCHITMLHFHLLIKIVEHEAFFPSCACGKFLVLCMSIQVVLPNFVGFMSYLLVSFLCWDQWNKLQVYKVLESWEQEYGNVSVLYGYSNRIEMLTNLLCMK